MFDNLKKKINDDMTKNVIREIITSEKNEFLSDLKDLINKIKNGDSKDNILKLVQNQIDNKSFIEIIDESISLSLTPFEETKYLREINLDNFKNIIDIIFEKTIIQVEQIELICDEAQLDKEQIKRINKFLNTLIDWFIVKRCTFNLFKIESYDLFRIDYDKIVFIYDKFNERKDELMNIVMLNNIGICKEIKKEINKLVDIFSEIFQEDDEDVEDSE